MKKFLLALFYLLLLCNCQVFCQTDTEFWFVAPEITIGIDGNNYDRPIFFRFSTYDDAATITIEQPANTAFPVQVITMPANTSQV
ncbi:MAG: hypothetical protein SFV52_10740, partial [Saprospiraceae bacterium]|nr:hypothetical protein [Saprospiraceae bacterium]